MSNQNQKDYDFRDDLGTKADENIASSKGIHHEGLIDQLEHGIGSAVFININILDIANFGNDDQKGGGNNKGENKNI